MLSVPGALGLLVLLISGAVATKMRPTPFGSMVAEECVSVVPSGTVVDLRGGIEAPQKFVLPDGEVQIREHNGTCIPRASSPKTRNLKQWIVAAEFQGTMPASQFNGLWTVPENPKSDSGQIIYTFTGIQPGPGQSPLVIAQPVLEYHEGQWSLASWWCCNHGHSASIPTAPGHVINGTMENHNGVWTIETKDMTTGQSTVLKVQTQETLSVYYISLETYSISQCSDYPTGSIPYSELALRNQAGQKVTPTWNADRIDPECGTTVAVSSPTAVSINF